MMTGVINTQHLRCARRMLRGFCRAPHLLSSTEQHYCQWPHFTAEEKAQRSGVMCPRSHSWEVAESGLYPWVSLGAAGDCRTQRWHSQNPYKTSMNQKDLVDEFNQHEAEPSPHLLAPRPPSSPALPHPPSPRRLSWWLFFPCMK